MQTQEKLIQEVKTSYLDKLVICYQDNEMLRQQEHMSLFTQEALSMFSHIIDACRGNNEQLHELLDDEDGEFFTDEQAKEFVNWRVFGTRYNGNNIYAQKLAEINKPKVSQSIGAQRAQAKKDRETAVFKEIEKNQNQAVGNFVTLDVDDITPEDETKIRSVLDKITPKGYAFKGCTVYLPINSKAKMSPRNTGIIYGESEAANRCREKVGKVVRTINGLGYQCTIPSITQIKKKDGTPQNLAYFNVNKQVNIHEAYMNTRQTNVNNDKLTQIISESIKKVLFESTDETQRLFDFLVDNNIATENEVILVTNINGYKPETLLAILKARTGYNSPEQYMSAECPDGECELDEGVLNELSPITYDNYAKGREKQGQFGKAKLGKQAAVDAWNRQYGQNNKHSGYDVAGRQVDSEDGSYVSLDNNGGYQWNGYNRSCTYDKNGNQNFRSSTHSTYNPYTDKGSARYMASNLKKDTSYNEQTPIGAPSAENGGNVLKQMAQGNAQYVKGKGYVEEAQLDEGFKNAVNNFKNKVKGVGKKISDYADKEWEDEPVKKKSGESVWGRNTPRK